MTNNHVRLGHSGTRRKCNICRAEYMRKYRRIVGLTPEGRKKMNARNYAYQYLIRGKIERRPCFICNSVEDPQFHHEDYDRPLMTLDLCRKHHVMVTHKKLSLIPSAVKSFWEFQRASRSVAEMISLERVIRRIKRECGQIKSCATQAI